MNKLLSLTPDEYHADKVGLQVPTLNYSTAKTILSKSPLHAWLEHPKGGGQTKPPKKAMDFGQIEHSMLLGKGAKAVLVDAENWRTKQAQADRDDAISKGLIPLLPKEYDEVIACATEVTKQLTEKGIALEGATEQAMVWEEDAVACRGCMDLFQPAPIHEITELKFTDWSLSESSIKRLIRTQSYDLQAATYCAGIHTITGEMPKFKWIFCEMTPPYLIRVVRPSDLLVQIGMRKWQSALAIWKSCLATGVWTGYGDDLVVDPEMWELREYEVSVYSAPEAIGEDYAEPSDDPMWF